MNNECDTLRYATLWAKIFCEIELYCLLRSRKYNAECFVIAKTQG